MLNLTGDQSALGKLWGIFDLQIFARFRSQEQGGHDAVEIGVIVPVALFQQKDVPVRQHEAGARDLEVQTERDSEGTHPHHRVYYYHPRQRWWLHPVDQWEMTVPRISPFYVDVCESSLFDDVYHHAQAWKET